MTSTSSEVSLSRIGQIAIVVHDVKKATAFYRDILGMRFLFEFPGLAFFDCDGTRLMLSLPDKPEFDHPSSVLYFRVGDIKQTHENLVSRGVRFDDQPHLIARLPDHDLWMTFFRDADDNVLALMSEVREGREGEVPASAT